MIDMWGINTKDDLMFNYLMDQKKVDGPRLDRHVALTNTYASGALSPFIQLFNGDSKVEGDLYAPFSSAKDGAKPGADGWKFGSATNPYSNGRSTKAMAQSMYNTGTAEETVGRRSTASARDAGQRMQYARD